MAQIEKYTVKSKGFPRKEDEDERGLESTVNREGSLMIAEMDPYIVVWVIEFLIRHKTPSSILNAFLADPYFSVREIDNPRLKKTICLRNIQDEVAGGAGLSESILESLEIIEEIVRKGGNLISRSMKLAYRAVAVECTVKYLRDRDEGMFFEAVVRIWRGRVEQLELKNSQLVTVELREFREEMESALWNSKACEKLLLKVGEIEAVKLVKDYVEEALAALGPSFIDLAAEAEFECRLKRKREAAKLDGGEAEMEEGNRSNAEPGLVVIDSSAGKDGNAVVTEDSNIAEASPDIVVLNRPARPDLKRRKKDGGEAEVVGQNQTNADPEQFVISAPARQGKEDGGKTVTEEANNVDTGPDLVVPDRPASAGVGEIQQGVVHERPRDTMDSQRVETGIASRKFNLIPTPVVVKVREALNHSLMELKALVKDPLPEALRVSDALRAELREKSLNKEPSVHNPNRNDAGSSCPPIDAEVSKATAEISNPVPSQVTQNTSTNAETAMPIRQVDAPKSSLMERNSTACTFEWNDSIDDSPQDKTAVEIRRKLPTSNKVENLVGRRQQKKWSLEEEEGLREGVKRFGAGNWALILKSNRSLFSERSSVDLKDKWRNMMKHSQG